VTIGSWLLSQAAPPVTDWSEYLKEGGYVLGLLVALWLGYTDRIVTGTRYRRELAERDARILEERQRGDQWKESALSAPPIVDKALDAARK
jgi:hypothetical protein